MTISKNQSLKTLSFSLITNIDIVVICSDLIHYVDTRQSSLSVPRRGVG